MIGHDGAMYECSPAPQPVPALLNLFLQLLAPPLCHAHAMPLGRACSLLRKNAQIGSFQVAILAPAAKEEAVCIA